MGRCSGAALLPLALLALAGLAAGQGDWQTGFLGQLGFGSTYVPAAGACGYGEVPNSSWPYGGFASIDPEAFPLAADAKQQGCGLCLEVQCTDAKACVDTSGKTLLVLVTDYCKGCGGDYVFLAPSAYGAAAGATTLGRVAGFFRQVVCEPPGGITVHIDTYRPADGGWMRLTLKNVAGGGDVEGVELTDSAQNPEAWRPMQRTAGARWELSGLPNAPLDLRVTGDAGQAVVIRSFVTQPGQTGDFATPAQFQASRALAASLGQAPPPSSNASASPPPPFGGFFSSPPPPGVQAPQPLPTPPQPSPAPSPPAPAPSSPPPPPPGPEVQLVAAGPAPAPESVLQAAGTAPASAPSSFFQLPAPTPAAPEVLDTRPPRPPGVGPSVTPAPAVFSTVAGLPTLPKQPAAAGPVDPAALQAAGGAATDPASCQTLADILARIPEAKNWTQLLRGQGLDVLLRDRSPRPLTLLVPIDSSLTAEIDARPLRNETNLTQLVLNAPEITNPLVGYHLLPGLWPSWALQPGVQIDTSDTINKVDRLKLTAQGPTQLQGIGSSTSILQGDIVACGPAVVHIVDQVLLPFTFNPAALDAVRDTGVRVTVPTPPLQQAGAPVTQQQPIVQALSSP